MSFSTDIDWKKATIKHLPLSAIQEDPNQPRSAIWSGDQADLLLIDSIDQYGVMMPICISNIDQKPTILDGHRRLRAAQLP